MRGAESCEEGGAIGVKESEAGKMEGLQMPRDAERLATDIPQLAPLVWMVLKLNSGRRGLVTRRRSLKQINTKKPLPHGLTLRHQPPEVGKFILPSLWSARPLQGPDSLSFPQQQGYWGSVVRLLTRRDMAFCEYDTCGLGTRENIVLT